MKKSKVEGEKGGGLSTSDPSLSVQALEDITSGFAEKCKVWVGGEGELDPLSLPVSKQLDVYDWVEGTRMRGEEREAESSKAAGGGEAGGAGGGGGRGGIVGLTCGTCGKVFESLEVQRSHFKTDFHKLNVRRSVAGKAPLTEDILEAIIRAGDDLSSISGSEESEVQEEEREGEGEGEKLKRKQFLVTFEHTETKERFGIPRSVLFPLHVKKDEDELDSREALLHLASSSKYWVVVMASGGHFAAAVFESKGKEKAKAVVHKTLHRYVVRAKAGGRQSAKDATGKKAQSAGASIRRHNERALAQDIKTLLVETWAKEVSQADRIFLYAPGVHNANIFFAGKDPIFDRKDSRIHKVPFTTRRPTFKEVCRIKSMLSTVYAPRPRSANLLVSSTSTSASASVVKKRNCSPSPGPEHGTLHEKENDPLGEEKQEEEEGGEGEGGEGEEQRSMSGSGSGRINPNFNEESDLHVAARCGNASDVLRLLESGADPCQKDLRGRPPYLLAKSKDVRDTFRRFRAKVGEEAFDWKAAGVPEALTQALEEAQAKKKAEKDAKRKKEKARRKAAQEAKKQAKKKEEEEEEALKKSRAKQEERKVKPFNMFSRQMTPRELMAQAAEARIRKMVGARHSKTR